MRHSIFALTVLTATLAIAMPARAQRTIAQDTMSTTTPVAVECGFCAMESYGVVFREVGAAGLVRSDFPLILLSVSLALGAARVSGTPATCRGQATPADPNTRVHVEIWAGTMTTDAPDIRALPMLGMPWPGESLVFTQDALPVVMSVPSTDGGVDVSLMLNTFNLGDATTPAPTIDATHTYLRVAVGLGSGGMSSTCTPVTNTPTGFPVRDDDGVVAPHRSFLYAQGMGWLWNEVAGVRGDWGIRLSVSPLPHGDAGPFDAGARDAAATPDAAMGLDAAAGSDAGRAAPGPGGGCSCRVASRASSTPSAMALALLTLALYSRKVLRSLNVTRPKRAGTWKSPSSGADQPTPR